jgi:nucleoside-diphosphate-sugar epimerase
MGEDEVCVVTGGRGFVARHVVLKLLEEGRFVVRIVDLAPTMTLSPEELEGPMGMALSNGRVQYESCDLRNKMRVAEALRGVSVVFHMASPDTSINNQKLHYDVSVTGTRNVIEACLKNGVKKLVYTSSPSICFDGIHGIYNADESLPICDTHNDHYSDAKAHAEALVLDANGREGLLTCAIRPSGIFGPGDRLAVPAFASSARAGKLKFIVGDGENMFDWTYVENVAHAHLCAERAMVPGEFEGEHVASGKAYFITNREPIRFWEFLTIIITGLGYPAPKYNLPAKVVIQIAEVVEKVANLLAPFGVKPPVNFNPVRLRIVTITRTFNCDRAMKLLGYKPIVSLDEGIRRTLDSMPHLRADAPQPESTTPREFRATSKMSSMIGGNAVGDLVMWKDPKKSAGVLFGILTVLYLFYSSGTTLLSALTSKLMFAFVAIFIYSYLPDPFFQISLPKIPPASYFELSEETTQAIALEVRSHWNTAWGLLDRIIVGRDFALFFKVMLVLRVAKLFGRFSFQTLLFTSLFAAFSVPYLYEQNEEEVDKLWDLGMDTFNQYWGLVASKLPEGLRDRLEQKKVQ